MQASPRTLMRRCACVGARKWPGHLCAHLSGCPCLQVRSTSLAAFGAEPAACLPGSDAPRVLQAISLAPLLAGICGEHCASGHLVPFREDIV